MSSAPVFPKQLFLLVCSLVFVFLPFEYGASLENLLGPKLVQAQEVTPSIFYRDSGFIETRNGAVRGRIIATLLEDTFQDTDGDNILDVGTEVTINNIPAGLTPVVTLFGSSTSTEPTAWTSATAPAGTWAAVAYGNGTFVAVGDNTIMYSANGITWTSANLPLALNLTAVTYGNDKFVAVGFEAPLYSYDGVTWLVGTGDFITGYNFESVVYGNDRYIAKALDSEDGIFMYSFDGIGWIEGAGQPSRLNTFLAFGNGLFVALSIGGGSTPTQYSSDGQNWLTGSGAGSSRAVTYGNGRFVSVTGAGTSRVDYSADGITWTAATAAAQNTWVSVAYGNGKFVAVSQDGTNRVMHSTDGITWTAATAAAQNTWVSVAYGKGRFVAVSSDGTNRVMYSSGAAPDKEAFLTLTGNAIANENVNDVVDITFTFDDSAFVSATSAAAVLNATGPASSGRGINFNEAEVVEVITPSVTYSGPGFTEAVENDGTVTGSIAITLLEDTFQDIDADNILDIGTEVTISNIPAGLTPIVTLSASPTSTEPTAWTSATVPAGTWYDMAYGNGTFVAVGDNVLMYSYDGITWATTTVPGLGGSFFLVTYGNGKFVALGDYPIYSTDGITWTLGDASNYEPVGASIAYGNGIFIAASPDSEDNLFTYSYDGITWFSDFSPPSRSLTYLAFGNGIFVAVRLSPNRYSAEGLSFNWSFGSSSFIASRAVTYGNGRFVTVADSGTDRVSYSTDGITWTSATAAAQNTWSDITYGNGKFVAVSEDGTDRVSYSTDGIAWTSATAAAQNTWVDVVYGDGKFVALSSDGTNRVMYSSGAAPDKIATLTLTGNATANENANDVSNITFSFANTAFISATSAASVLNATGPASSGRGIDFTNAVVATPPSSGGGGGGGGGSSRFCNDPKASNYKPDGKGKPAMSACRYDTKTTTPIATPTSTPTPVSPEVNAIRQSLLSQIAQLQALLAKLRTGSSSTVSTGTGSSSTTCVYTRNLTLQMVGEDVKCLQKYLNRKGFVIAATGSGAPGFESTYFGIATQNALKRFQNANAASVLYPAGLTEGTGYFGATTRDFVTKNP